MRGVGIFLVAALLVPGGIGCAASPPGPPADPKGLPSDQPTVPGEYLVTLAPGADVGAVRQVYGSLGLKKVEELGGGVVLVALEKDPGLARMKELQAQDARIQAVQPNFVYKAFR
jgi:hypothetical protein